MPIGAFKLTTISAAASVAADSYFILTSTGSEWDDRACIEVDSNKSIYIQSEFGLAKINETGTYAWVKTWDTVPEYYQNIFIGADGNPVLASSISTDQFLFRFNSTTGAQVSCTKTTVSGADFNAGNARFKLVHQDSSGNYILAIGRNPQPTIWKTSVTKWTSAGAFVSNREFYETVNEAARGHQIHMQVLDSSGNLYLFNQAYNPFTARNEFLLHKFNTGAMTHTYVKNINSASYAFPAPAGAVVDSSGNLYFRTGRNIFKLDSSGTQVWQKQISLSFVQDDTNNGNVMAIDSNNNIYVGFIVSANNKNYILKIDTSGNVIYSRSFRMNNTAGNNLSVLVRNGSLYLNNRAAQVQGSTTGVFIAKLPLDGTLTGTYASTLIYATESVSLADSSVFSITSASAVIATVNPSSASITPALSNNTLPSLTKTTL